MGKTTGCVLILAGLAVGSYALYPELRSVVQASAEMTGTEGAPAAVSGGAAAVLKAVMKVAGAPTPTPAPTADKPVGPDAAPGSPQVPKASPAEPAPLPSKGEPGGPDKLETIGPPAPGVTPPPHLVPPAPVPAKRQRTAVASVKVNETPPRVPVGDTRKGTPPLEGGALAREIQVQLKRVGCYRGDATGAWTPSVRQALRDFTEAANASLPVNEPDPVLLAMLQSHGPGACSGSCPRGQERAAGGRCVPSVLAGLKDGTGGKAVARDRSSVKASSGASSGVKASVAATKDGGTSRTATRTGAVDAKKRTGSAPLAGGVAPDETIAGPEGRMSLAGPPAADAPLAKRPQASARRQAKVAGSSSRSAPRSRRAYRPSYGKGYTTGLPGWALPFFMQ